MKLYQHQIDGLKATEGMTRVAYYWDMGLGKTFEGSEKLIQLGAKVNLIVCQKSKINDWYDHFRQNYPSIHVHDLRIWEKADWEGLEAWNEPPISIDGITDVFIITEFEGQGASAQ